MFKNITYRRKLVYLISGTFVFLVFVYFFAWRQTIGLRAEYREGREKLGMLEDAPRKILGIENRLKKIEKIIGEVYSGDVDVQDILLEKVSSYCKQNNLTLKEFPGAHQYVEQNYLIETSTVTVEGPFVKLLRLLYSIEKEYVYGKVVSARFSTQINFKTRQKKLLLSIYIQNIKNLENEASMTENNH